MINAATFVVQTGPYGEGVWLSCEYCSARIELEHGTSFSEVVRQVDEHVCNHSE